LSASHRASLSARERLSASKSSSITSLVFLDVPGHVSHEVEAVFLRVWVNLYLFVTIFELSLFSSFLLSFFYSCFDVEVQASPGRMTQRMTQRKEKKRKELIGQQILAWHDVVHVNVAVIHVNVAVIHVNVAVMMA
jgi:hypothetical protein